jgi:hypothetical protein
MLSIATVLFIVFLPLLIPAAVTAFHAITHARQRRRVPIANSLGGRAGSVGGQTISHEHTRRVSVA